MGLKNSSAIFQHCLESILNGITGVRIYQDDILVFADTQAKLVSRENAVLHCLSKANVSVNREKCVHRVNSVDFLGVHLSASGIKPAASLVQRIMDIDAPKNINELERFLGLLNFYRKFIHAYADKVEPLLEAKRGTFTWSVEQDSAFRLLKEDLICGPILQPFSFNHEITLSVNASPHEPPVLCLSKVIQWHSSATHLLKQNETGPTLSGRLLLWFGQSNGSVTFCWVKSSS